MKVRGLTLIELMVTLAVIGIVLAVGAPKIANLGTRNTMSTSINRLTGDIAYARSEAIKRNVPVAVTATDAGGDWTQGWTITAGAQTLRVADAIPNVFTLTEASASTVVTFLPSGRKSGSGAISFTLCKTGLDRKQIDIIASGRAALSTGAVCP